MPPVKLGPQRLVLLISKVLAMHAAQECDAAGVQHVHRIRDLRQGRLHIWHRQAGKEPEPIRVLLHSRCPMLVDLHARCLSAMSSQPNCEHEVRALLHLVAGRWRSSTHQQPREANSKGVPFSQHRGLPQEIRSGRQGSTERGWPCQCPSCPSDPRRPWDSR